MAGFARERAAVGVWPLTGKHLGVICNHQRRSIRRLVCLGAGVSEERGDARGPTSVPTASRAVHTRARGSPGASGAPRNHGQMSDRRQKVRVDGSVALSRRALQTDPEWQEHDNGW